MQYRRRDSVSALPFGLSPEADNIRVYVSRAMAPSRLSDLPNSVTSASHLEGRENFMLYDKFQISFT